MTDARIHALHSISDEADRLYQAGLSRLTCGLSPAGLTEMTVSWLAHLAMCPGRVAELASFPLQHLPDSIMATLPPAEGAPRDPRFRSDSWNRWPWNAYVQQFHLAEDFWERATKGLPGFSPEHERAVAFAARQFLDAAAPTNFIATNPDVLAVTAQSGGENLQRGWQHVREDVERLIHGEPPPGTENFIPGKTLAVTPGKVVFRNHLMELIQYAPQTPTVRKEPILLLPAWIMKYYILDLSPGNSLVRWLVGEGHTVFIVSWRNPGSEDRDTSMDDYVREGALAALDAVSAIQPGAGIHLAGYCLGGTLAMITAALLAREGDTRLKSLSLFAAQGDFTEAGEMMTFVTHSEIAYLKNMMWAQGYLDTKQMAGAFQMLRSYDMVWSRMVHDYLMGERTALFDLMAWNADATRMPYKMHSEYLERLFLANEFADGNFTVFGKPVAPENITVPVFAVGTEKDHVAPWKSVYKVHLMMSGDVTFALANGGHNAGIVSEPGHPHRYYALGHKKPGSPYQSPDVWLEQAARHEGSWWTAWGTWLDARGSRTRVSAPKRLGNATYKPLGDAPGTYVHQK